MGLLEDLSARMNFFFLIGSLAVHTMALANNGSVVDGSNYYDSSMTRNLRLIYGRTGLVRNPNQSVRRMLVSRIWYTRYIY